MSFILQGVLSLGKTVISTAKSFFGIQAHSTDTHLSILHAPYLVLYRGSDTYVPVTALRYHGKKSAFHGNEGAAKVYLVRKGWRCGVFGWDIGKWLGARTVKGMDVTPVTEHGRPDSASTLEGSSSTNAMAPTGFPEKQLETYEKQRKEYIKMLREEYSMSENDVDLTPVATHIVRIPAVAEDGYFRLVVKYSNNTMAISPDFRVYSVSLSSACPRGAGIIPPTIAPELVLRALSTSLSAVLMGLFPVATILEKILPRRLTRGFMRWAYRTTFSEERKRALQERYRVGERFEQVKHDFFEMMPFSSAGIRTDHDLNKDEEYGVGGVTYWL